MCIIVLENLPLPFHNRLKSRWKVAIVVSRSCVYFDFDLILWLSTIFSLSVAFFAIPIASLRISILLSLSHASNLSPNLLNPLPLIFPLPELL
ncbi:hypothetical protein L873DRAFT_1813554 [Choiromyces venosus 120613-1]|uniref:Uncharacterized protein n=1 Tax=Choiromyces venosus 120613-1 TaxID=1336337 RepID=A0A3N4J9M1_9PEZI|nr:hypothetical protein L873DRAFT_1813554 [Choiromyces venosus 120613-1]